MRNNEKNNDEIEIVNEVEVIDAVNEVVVMKKFFTPIKIGISIAIILVITIVGGISYNKYSIAKAEKVKIANEELYMEKLKLVTYSIIEQGVVIEAMTQEISTIQHDVIYNKSVVVDGTRAFEFNTRYPNLK